MTQPDTSHPLLLKAMACDLDTLLPLVRAYHSFEEVDLCESARSAAISTLLAHPDYGAIYLISVVGEVVGYIVLAFGFSLEFGGRDAFVDEFFIAPSARGKGLGSAVLAALPGLAAELGLHALHLEVAHHNTRAQQLYGKAGFLARARYMLMSRAVPSA